ncbi:MAG: class I SAM-dependent methyltransferase [Dissulfurispiraceae bacterium]|jgi:SAM-dependent methyltransferase|nr:class I SAM-dependent methyltransferase [Dissulfurispiraceae bacterium]
MKIYDIIADRYDSIFPVEATKIDFIASQVIKEDANILDIGCATGELAYRLSTKFNNARILGIDLNSRMISIANRNYKTKNNLHFEVRDMTEYQVDEKVDLALCIGNTLPHLKDKGELIQFLGSIYSGLNVSGRLILQFLNYDKIVKEGQISFEKIETEDTIFLREYRDITKERIKFNIKLIEKETLKEHQDSVELTPIYEQEVENILKNIGYMVAEKYGSWKKQKSDYTNFYKVIVAKKN